MNLANQIPNHFVKRFESVEKALFVEFAHGIVGVAHGDGNFFEFQFVNVNFADDFAVIFIAIGSGVDDFGGVAGISPET